MSWDGATPSWSQWTSQVITSGGQYYLYNEYSGLFLNTNSNNADAVAIEPSTLWILSLSGDKCTINNGTNYVWIDVKKNGASYDGSSAHSFGDASGDGASHSLSYVKDGANRYRFYHNRKWGSTHYGAGFLAVNKGNGNNELSSNGGGWGADPLSYWWQDRGDEPQNYWYVIPQNQYESAEKEAEYYLLNVGTHQFLSFQKDENDSVKSYITNNPANASLVTIQLKHIVGVDTLSYVEAEVDEQAYYLYNNNGNNVQYTKSDFPFKFSKKTIGGITGYQLTTDTDYKRYAFAGDGNFLANRSASELTFSRDKGNDLNSLWLFITPEEFITKKQKLAPVHVPFIYDRFMFYDGEITTREGAGKWDNDRVWLNAEKDTFDIHFEGIPEHLSFKYKPKTAKGGLIENRLFSVMQSPDGVLWSEPIFDTINNNSGDYLSSDSILLEPTTRYLRFCIDGCTAAASDKDKIGGCFKNIQITELHQFEAFPDTINFGKVNVEEFPHALVTFNHVNAGSVVSVEKSLHFDVSPSTIPKTGRDKMGTEYVEVTFEPDAGVNQSYSEKIYFTDLLGNKDSVVVIGEATTLKVPKYTWNPEGHSYYCSPSEGDSIYYIPNICTSTNESVPLRFSSSDEAIAKVKDGKLYIYTKDNETPSEVKIYVEQDSINGVWVEGKDSLAFTPHKKPNVSVPFQMTEEIFHSSYIYSKEVNLKIEGFPPHYVKDKGYKWDEESGIKLGGENSDVFSPWFDFPSTVYEEKYIIIEFEGTPDSLFFEYRTNNSAATEAGLVGFPANWYVYESVNGVFGETPSWSGKRSESSYASAAMALLHSTRYIKLVYQGNFAGYFNNVRVTAYDGYCFIKSGNKYLSRGGDNRDKIVVDDYGIAVRKTRSCNKDKSYIFTHFQHVDNRKYVCTNTEGVLIANVIQNKYFVLDENGVIETVNSEMVPEAKYLKINDDGTLEYTNNQTNASRWMMELPAEHQVSMTSLKDAQARAATTEFGEPIETYGRLNQRLRSQDYDRDTVYKYNPVTALEQYEGGLENVSHIWSTSVADIDTGLYRLNVKAFYRISTQRITYDAYIGDYDCPVAYAYAKDGQSNVTACTQICSLFDSEGQIDPVTDNIHPDTLCVLKNGKEMYFPNGISSAAIHLSKNWVYDNDVYIYVHEISDGKGSLEIGIESPSNSGYYNWLCYKDITLTRLYRKEYVFDNQAKDNDWSNGQNWEYDNGRGKVPESMHKVVINAPAKITNDNRGAYCITYGTNGNITIGADASLSVREGGFSEEYKNGNHITLEANNSGKTGVLRIYPGTPAPKATVKMFSKAYYARQQKADGKYNTDEANWQYIGTPVKNNSSACSIQDVFYQDWLYRWNVTSSGAGDWINARVEQYSPMIPFAGYTLTQMQNPSGRLYAHVGELITSDLDSIFQFRSPKGYVIANSFAAPIDLRNFKSDDFGANMQKTIYVFNTGSQKNINQASSVEDSPGQYTAMPINMTELQSKIDAGYSPFIPPMQAFVLKHIKKTDEGNSIRLRYDDLVWSAKYDKAPNAPLRAPMRGEGTDAERVNAVYMQVYSGHSLDKLYLFESDEYTHAFDNGYDAEKMNGTVALSLYAVEGTKKMSLDATPQINETYIGFHSDADSIYTFRFKYVGTPEQLYLLDQQTGKAVPMVTDTTWSFIAVPDSAYALRFRIVDESLLPIGWDVSDIQLTTSIDNVTPDTYVELWQEGDNVFAACLGKHILYLYDAKGQLVATQSFVGSCVQDITELTSGIYVAKVENKVIKVVKK